MEFTDLTFRVKRVLFGIWGAGLVSVGLMLGWPLIQGDSPQLGIPLLAFIVFATLAELFPVTFEGRYEITVSTVFLVGATIVFQREPELAGLTALISALIANVVARKPWFKVLTNVSLTVTSVSLATLGFVLVGTNDTFHLMGATTLLLVIYFLADTVPLTILVASLEESPFLITYVNNYRRVVLEQVGMQLFGVIFAILWLVNPWLSPLWIVPVAILRQAYFQVERLRSESVNALSAIADIIENRDVYTHNHTASVANYARHLAERLGLGPDEVSAISIAGRMHDLGKISVSDNILLKPGKLTSAEMAVMQKHCQVGYDVLANFTNLKSIATIVRSHHERFDGQGYPQGLSGDAIPIGASIIAVVDAFDAMTTDRPYRKAMPVEKALDILRQGLGTQWHPVVGATFIQMALESQAAHQADDKIIQMPDVAA